MDNYSLFELNEYIRRIISLNCPAPLWVRFELAQVSESRGHYYLNLIEKDETSGQIIAESQAVIWKTTYRRLRRQLGKNLDGILQNGMMILAKIQVDYHEKYGLKLMIEEIDSSYTLGKLEVERSQTITKLKKTGLIDLNKHQPLPIVVQKIAIISSSTAAGYKDFFKQISANDYGYDYYTHLYNAAVQGQNAVQEIIAQLTKINQRSKDYDCIVIVRGGGARLDLMAFDDFELCKAIAESKLPVLIGIGHEVDEVVADFVAHGSFKTPTAVGAFLVQKNLYFESQLLDIQQNMLAKIQQRIEEEAHQLNSFEQFISMQSTSLLTQHSRMLEYISQELPRQFQLTLKNGERDLAYLAKQVELLNPQEILRRGYAVLSKGDRVVNSAEALQSKEKISILLQDGTVDAIID